MNRDARSEQYEHVELFGMSALFTNSRIDRATLPEGLFCYDLRGSDSDFGDPVTVEPFVFVNHAGCLITSIPIDFQGKEYLTMHRQLNFLGDDITTLDEYMSLENSTAPERQFDNLIAACEDRVRPAPDEYPAYDYPWGIREVGSVDGLIEQFRHGNWSVRTGFVLGDLAFVEQVSGGNEWLALKLDGGEWKSFDSISFYAMFRQRGEDGCRDYIERLITTPWHDLKYPSEPEGPTMRM